MAQKTATIELIRRRRWWGYEFRSPHGQFTLRITYWMILKEGRAQYKATWLQLLLTFAVWWLRHGRHLR